MKITNKHTKLALLYAFFAFYTSSAFCQKYDPGIMQTVNTLFDGMRAGDSTMVRSAFALGSTLMSVPKNPSDSVVMTTKSTDDFVKAVGKPHSEKWDEQIYNERIIVDGPMAIVWVPYKFFLGEKFSHCGVNVFTLIKLSTGWKISSITDTRREDGCF